MKTKGHVIQKVHTGSIAEELGIEPGDRLIAVNDTEIEDIFDYQYLTEDTYLEVLIQKGDETGEEWLLEIDKDEDEDLGIVFEKGLMDDYKHCCNKCIFCFIDQMPPGLRDTLYFKDDDSRLSFLQGNYVTLTNMSYHDIDRIIKYHLGPINISIHSMNPELRVKMLHNRFAGEALKKIDLLYEGGIPMNGQIVLCRGINDGEELERSIREMAKYAPLLESVSVVPVGLSKYREGLHHLEPFDEQSAKETLAIIHKWQKIMYERVGLHFVHASDEWYFLAKEELPKAESYDGYLQLENGVGMITLLTDEFHEAMETVGAHEEILEYLRKTGKEKLVKTIATGRLAAGTMQKMADEMMERFPFLDIRVVAIRNDFFGERITVSGLLTGQDMIAQLKPLELGETVLLPENVLRSGENYFLDDVTVPELEQTLQVSVDIVKSSGMDFVEAVLRLPGNGKS
ncbi:MAG: DUF512 domain-containing protein [Lachnospiraceae bacterium]|nr:DUF512 domain-containing protein [Lachnospiraceae bacterium]